MPPREQRTPAVHQPPAHAAPPAHGDGWEAPARVSGVVFVGRPPPAPVRASPALFSVAAAVFATGLATGFVIGRATAPSASPTERRASAPVAAVAAPRPAPAPIVVRLARAAEPAAAPPVDAAAPHLTAAQVIATQRAHAGRTRDCANRARRGHPDLAGRARITVVIEPDGRVRDAVWTRAEPSQVRAVGCIADAVRRWRFPPTGYAGAFVAELPFDLATGMRPRP